MLPFSSSDVLTIITALIALITALGAIIVNIIVAVKTNKSISEVHTLVNKTATDALVLRESMQKELDSLKLELAEGKKEAALLAQKLILDPKGKK